LQDCGLEELPPGIAGMTKLKKLYILFEAMRSESPTDALCVCGFIRDLAGNKFPLPAAGSLPLQVEQL
jgi:hypothetical protein